LQFWANRRCEPHTTTSWWPWPCRTCFSVSSRCPSPCGSFCSSSGPSAPTPPGSAAVSRPAKFFLCSCPPWPSSRSAGIDTGASFRARGDKNNFLNFYSLLRCWHVTSCAEKVNVFCRTFGKVLVSVAFAFGSFLLFSDCYVSSYASDKFCNYLKKLILHHWFLSYNYSLSKGHSCFELF